MYWLLWQQSHYFGLKRKKLCVLSIQNLVCVSCSFISDMLVAHFICYKYSLSMAFHLQLLCFFFVSCSSTFQIQLLKDISLSLLNVNIQINTTSNTNRKMDVIRHIIRHISPLWRLSMNTKCLRYMLAIVWVFRAQMVEHCSVNAEPTGSNPIESPKSFFRANFAIV